MSLADWMAARASDEGLLIPYDRLLAAADTLCIETLNMADAVLDAVGRGEDVPDLDLPSPPPARLSGWRRECPECFATGVLLGSGRVRPHVEMYSYPRRACAGSAAGALAGSTVRP